MVAPGLPTIRALAAHEWQTFRALRIAALTESPDAFSPTAEEALAFPDAHWQAVARSFVGEGRRLFIALEGDSPCGLVSAVVGSDGAGHLGAMWVAPALRGSGLGARLFDTACAWLVASGCPRLALTVTDGNDRAERLYARRGFVRSGGVEPLRPGSPLLNVEMVKQVTREG